MNYHFPVRAGSRLFLMDVSSFIHRAYHASKGNTDSFNRRPSDGAPIGAVRAFCGRLLSFMSRGAVGVMPTHFGAVMDYGKRNWRHDVLPSYKGTRPELDYDLRVQIPLIGRAIHAFGLHRLSTEGYEADDLIATYVEQATSRHADVLIISADKDLMQLVGPGVAFYDPPVGRRSDPTYRPARFLGHNDRFSRWNIDEGSIAPVSAEWGDLPPSAIRSVLALAGDTVDNVPGARGIGKKTAIELMHQFGDIETMLANVSDIRLPKKREILSDPVQIESIRTSYEVVGLRTDAPCQDIDDLAVRRPYGGPIQAFLKEMELSVLRMKVHELYGNMNPS